jgi:beta-glucosidase
VHDRVASRVRPIRELKGFRKVALQPGEQVEVEFVLDRHALAFTRANGEFGAEPGLFDLWIAPSAEAGEPVRFELLRA